MIDLRGFPRFFFLQGLERTLDDHKILLLEAAPDKPQNITSAYSNRVSNITPGSKKLLESKMFNIGVLSTFIVISIYGDNLQMFTGVGCTII